MAARGNIKLTLEGRGALTLRDADYIASGGEGSIYRAKDTVVKLYADPKKMARDGMSDKIRVLASRLKLDGIVAPQGVALDESSAPVGYYMPFADGEPMSRFFVSDFRNRVGFRDSDSVSVAEQMREIVEHAHAQRALMVDANEMNWIVGGSKRRPAPKVIDVDSWAIDRWPATVIMPSIRDWNAASFDEKTDWFAWGVVAFQLFTGIHPYKGKMEGYKPGEMVRRMRDNASVFDRRAKLPHSVRDFSAIPAPLLEWFRTTFQDGLRSAPPAATAAGAPAKAARVVRAVTSASGMLSFEKIFGVPENKVVRVWPSGAALLESGDLVAILDGRVFAVAFSKDCEVARVPGGWLVAGHDASGQPILDYSGGGKQERLPFGLAVRRFFRSGERLFAVTDREMIELNFRILGRPIATAGARTAVRPNSTRWFDGVAVQDVLGAAFLVLPVDAGVVQPRVKELDGADVVAARAFGRFVAFAVLDRSGDYRKIEITFDKTFSSHSVWTGGADGADLNMASPSTGVVAVIAADGELALFVPGGADVRKIRDGGIGTDMRLASWGDKLIYVHDGAVWRLRMTQR